MKNMKALVFKVGVVVILVFAASGGVVVAGMAEQRKGQSQVARGRSVYAANCARCHGGDGMSHTTMGEITAAPDLTDAEWQSRRSTARMISSVASGRGDMPGFGKKLSRSDIAAAVAYVRTLKR
jgi:cytochrome c oxidase cbb3-type subunit III